MPAQIQPNRLDVTDRFPMCGFTIRTDGSPQRAEVAIATDLTLFRPENKTKRTNANFYSSRATGPLSVPRGEAIYVVPPQVLARFRGADRVYFGLATAPEGNGASLHVEVMPSEGSPYISLKGLTERSLRRVRLLPSRQQRAAGYGGNGAAGLEWAGDSAAPGMQPASKSASPPPATKEAPPAETPAADRPVYDDGFGPLPPPPTTSSGGTTPTATKTQSYYGEAARARSLSEELFAADDYGITGPIPDAETQSALPSAQALEAPQPEYPGASRFAPAHPSNYHVASQARTIDRIVIHITDGGNKISGTIGWFQNPDQRNSRGQPIHVSSHYVVGQDGEVVQMVRNNDMAHHASQANSRSIGIEHVARSSAIKGVGPRLVPSQAEYQASAALVAWLCGQFDIPVDREHIVGHNQISPRDGHTDCPDSVWDWDHYMELVSAAAAASAASQALGVGRWPRPGSSRAFGDPGVDAGDAAHGIEGPIPDGPNAESQSFAYSRPLAQQPEYPQASRFVPAAAGNYRPVATTRAINRVVIHITDGGQNINGPISWFQNPSARVSAHYIVGQDGEVVQMVRHNDVAWHAGNANGDSIGIEHVANTRGLLPTEAEYCASAALVRWLCDNYGIPMDRDHVLGHAEADSHTSHTGCPNAVWDWGHYMDLVGAAATSAGSQAQALTAPRKTWSHAQDAQDALKSTLTSIAASSDIARYSWKDRGVAPAGYIKGMALVYARAYAKLKAGDAAALEMAKAKTADPGRDALAWYDDIFVAAGMSNDTAGVDSLRHLFVLLIGLGMRESSGRYCEGRDRSAKNTTAETAEAGLFQTSFNARTASALLPALFAQYSANPSGFLDVFQEGVQCSASDLENFGSGDGKEFQRLSKECPAFAAEFAAVALRNIRMHWGPINRKGAEVRPECDAMLRQIEDCVDASGLLSEGLSARAPEGDRQKLQKLVSQALVVGLEDRQKARKYGPPFRELFQWSVPKSVVRAIEARGFKVQTIDAAVGDFNLDRYPVAITRFPEGWDAPRLLQYFIRNINQFVNTTLVEFIPYDESDAQRLASSDPTGTVLKLDLFGPDNAAIVISAAEPQFYIVSTINTPWSGDHPVSGHRQFGYIIEDDKTTTFYTRAADRATLGFPGTEHFIFWGGEKTWESFQSKLAAFINDNGGMAEIISPFSERFNATAMREEFGRFDVVQSLAEARAMSNGAFTLNWDEVELIPQPTDFSCWAAAAAMVVGWKDRVSLSPETVGTICNRTTASGLDPTQIEQFAREIGLVFENPQCYTIDGFRNLLGGKGPLWVAADVPGLHAIVVTGMYQDGTDSFVRITDPWDRQVGTPGAPGTYLTTHSTGSRYIMRWDDFVKEYEKAPMSYPGVNLQILHSGGTAGHQANYGFPSPPPGYAQSLAARATAARAERYSRPTRLPPPPKAQARPFDAPGAPPSQPPRQRVRGGTAEASWELDQYNGIKAPASKTTAGSPVRIAGPTINLSDWPYIDGRQGRTYAALAIDWFYGSGGVGDVQVSVPHSMANDGYLLKVTADIADGPDTATVAALRVIVRYEFSRAGEPTQIAVSEVTLYGDGRYERRNHDWQQTVEASAA